MKVFKFIFGALTVIFLLEAFIAPHRPGWPTFGGSIQAIANSLNSAVAYAAAWLRGLLYN